MTCTAPNLGGWVARLVAGLIALGAAGAVAAPVGARPPDAPDMPDAPLARSAPAVAPVHSYAEALQAWHGPDDLNAWIGAHFEYDASRAGLLSESRRAATGRTPVLEPEAFFAAPRGVCIDLARFAVETLRAVDPAAQPAYLMIEFAPVTVGGEVYRRHWLVMVRDADGLHFIADSKRPGHRAGPYASVEQFIDAYARYRGREVVTHRVLDSHERRMRSRAVRRDAESRR